jgi:hypothetical protein
MQTGEPFAPQGRIMIDEGAKAAIIMKLNVKLDR